MRFNSVECDKGDTVRVASVMMDVLPGLFRVVKKGRNAVYLAPHGQPDSEAKPWHKSRVIEVVDLEQQPKRRGRPPKPRPPESLFSLSEYVARCGAELWVRSGKKTSSNIMIEREAGVFWNFRIDPKTGRPKMRFYGGVPDRIGRKFKLNDYDAKVAVLKRKGYSQWPPSLSNPS